MKYIIILVVVLFVIWKSRVFLRGYIQKIINKKKVIPVVNTDLIYTPIVSSRTFYFAIKIDEVGGGQASVSVVKVKDLP